MLNAYYNILNCHRVVILLLYNGRSRCRVTTTNLPRPSGRGPRALQIIKYI